MDLYDVEVTAIEGRRRKLGDFAGTALLIVNVASRCGFTPQYQGLEGLYRRYRERGFAVLGFPCDQFGHQEPGDETEIRAFCDREYGVTFPMFAKIEVNGPGTHPLYQRLKQAAPGLFGTRSIKWNFTKFLVDGHGRVVHRFGPRNTPESLAPHIEALLP